MIEHQSCNNKSNHLVKLYNYCYQEMQAGHVELKYITSEDQVADLLT